ncbi:MAG TPA: 30S ribosomal protein S1 [Candidatus Eisenbacteria bacterium]|nr:30S ribosomal protein S1 [Candidatus Eisenbacteria bacterium]
MTEDQQGGTMPPAKANAEAPTSEDRVATVAVADEPAEVDEPEQAATTESLAQTDGRDTDGAAGIASTTELDPVVAETAIQAPAAKADTAEAPADTAEAPAAEPATVGAQSSDSPAGQATATEDQLSAAPATEPEPAAAVTAPSAETAAADGAPAAEAAPAAPAEAAPTSAPARARPTGPEPTTMEELLAEQDTEIKSFKHGDVVEGTVVRIDKDEILVDIGAKSEGVVSNRELFGRNAEAGPPLAVGDTVLVYVLQPESPEGHVVLSLRRAGLERKWRSMQEQFEAGVIIEAPVIDHNKGGLIVDCGIRGFVPISQIVDFPRRPQNDQPRDAAQEIAEKLQPFVGRKLRLKILEVNRKANRLILSEKVALYEERREKRDELFSSLQVGQKVTGNVRSIAPFGVFIDLGGIDGLVHKSELSWNKVNNPESGYHVGEEVEAEVIDINHERGRISLSVRRLQPDPWHSTVADFNVGDIIDGTVTKLVNFGAFVRVRDGLEGLIHISELSNQRVAHPGDVVHEGQPLKLRIISLDSERHRLGLSLKQAEEAAPARPAPEPAPAGAAAATPGLSQPARGPRTERERRPRSGERERSYSSSDAVQEPEGGIDTTLAAAFAGVREQLAKAEAAEAPEAEPETAEASAVEAPEAETAAVQSPEAQTAEAEAVAQEPATAAVESPEAQTVEAETAEAETPDAEASLSTEAPEAAVEAPEAAAASEPEAPAADASAATASEASAGEIETPAAEAEAKAEPRPAAEAPVAAVEAEPEATESAATTADSEPAAVEAPTEATAASPDSGKKSRRSAKASEPEASGESAAAAAPAKELATPEPTAAD